MRKAFTMIELILVIVIIGVLSAIAIPKLNATRDDATITKIVHNANTLFTDFESYYFAQGNKVWKEGKLKDMTNVAVGTECGTNAQASTKITPNTFVLCHEGTICLSFETINEGNLTITDGTSTSDFICEAVKGMVPFSNKIHKLGGSTISL